MSDTNVARHAAAHATQHGFAGPIADVAVVADLAAARDAWRDLAADGISSPYQAYDWIEAWQRHVGVAEGVVPFLVVGRDAAGTPQFLWPLGRMRHGPLTIARSLGGKHANFNFGLWRRGAAASLDADGMQAALDRLAAVAPGIDLITVPNQPQSWDGVPNPFLTLPHQPSPDQALRFALGASGEEVLARRLSANMRGKMRGKERKFAQLPGYRYARAETTADVDRILAAFRVQKAAYFAAIGVADSFAEPGVMAFLRDACLAGLADGRPAIELHALECDSGVIAMFGGVADGRRFSGMFNSYDPGEMSRHSPGMVILVHMIRHYADRGFTAFDLGVGDFAYKHVFCDEAEPLSDSFLPLTPLGRLAAVAMRSASDVKRRIKSTPALWHAVSTLRRQLGGN